MTFLPRTKFFVLDKNDFDKDKFAFVLDKNILSVQKDKAFDLYRMHLVAKLEKVQFNIHKYLSYMSLITLILAGYGVTG